jgi:hypothetical protein
MPEPMLPTRDVPPVSPVAAFAAFLEGWRRMLQAPAVLLGVAFAWWLPLQVASPTVFARFEAISFAGQWPLFVYLHARQLAEWYAPEVQLVFFGPGAFPRVFIATLALQSLLWMFLSGGALDRYARGRRIGAAAFFAACGVYLFRFLRLGVAVAIGGIGLMRLRQWLGPNPYAEAAILLLLIAATVVIDFARVRAVVEDRLSMLGAVAASLRFVRRRPWRVAALTLLNCVAVLVVLRFQMQVLSPSGEQSPWLLMLMLVVGVAVRLACLASEVVFFQGELAHAGYTAAPLPIWPDSPSVEAMDNLQRQHRLDNRPR